MDKFINMYKHCMFRSGIFLIKMIFKTQVGLDGKTFDSYFSVLEHTYQIQKLQPYFNNQLKRLAKTPKIFSIDTGVLCHLCKLALKMNLTNHH